MVADEAPFKALPTDTASAKLSAEKLGKTFKSPESLCLVERHEGGIEEGRKSWGHHSAFLITVPPTLPNLERGTAHLRE